MNGRRRRSSLKSAWWCTWSPADDGDGRGDCLRKFDGFFYRFAVWVTAVRPRRCSLVGVGRSWNWFGSVFRILFGGNWVIWIFVLFGFGVGKLYSFYASNYVFFKVKLIFLTFKSAVVFRVGSRVCGVLGKLIFSAPPIVFKYFPKSNIFRKKPYIHIKTDFSKKWQNFRKYSKLKDFLFYWKFTNLCSKWARFMFKFCKK